MKGLQSSIVAIGLGIGLCPVFLYSICPVRVFLALGPYKPSALLAVFTAVVGQRMRTLGFDAIAKQMGSQHSVWMTAGVSVLAILTAPVSA